MEQENKELPIQCSYFPSLYEDHNDIFLEVSKYQIPLLVHCQIARALEFMGNKVHMIIDRRNNNLCVIPNIDNAQWQQLVKQSPLWMATYEEEMVELHFDGVPSKHQQIKDRLLTIIQEMANTTATEEFAGIKINGTYSYELGGLCFPLNSNTVKFTDSAGYEVFRKYASDVHYYRIKISAIPFLLTGCDDFSFNDRVNEIRNVFKK